MKGEALCGNINVAFWVVTKYKYKIMSKFEYKNLIVSCIRRAAFEHKIKIIEIEVMPEHVHVVVRLPGTMSPSKACNYWREGRHIFSLRCILKLDWDIQKDIYGVEESFGHL